MLTLRGWWFLVLLLTVAAVGGVLAVRNSTALWYVALSLAVWLFGEWAAFVYRVRVTLPGVAVRRTIMDERGPVTTLWCHQTYRAVVEVTLPGGRLPTIELIDRPPAGAELTGPSGSFAGCLTPPGARWETPFRADHPGVVRFEGVAVRFADAQGFFYAERFIRDPLERPALPSEPASESARRADKRVNLLPPPGVHRHRRAGTGSELLELRDYRPGDPPRQIAWKVSARRDMLITREYESEVPLRCTLVVDASAAMCRGPAGKTPLARAVRVAAAVARVAIANRDLVGLVVAGPASSVYLPPSRSSVHLVGLLETLARAAPTQAIVASDDVAALLPRAYALAQDLYPELMHPSVNAFPAWLPWISPPPVYVRGEGRRPRWSLWRTVKQINSPSARRRMARRKRLAALLAAKYDLPPGAPGMLLDDDHLMAGWLQRFLSEHRVPYDVPETDADGRDLLATADSLSEQARRLVHAVSRGRDNELFVLLGDYARREAALDELLRAVRVARARHHQVVVVQPGPAATDPGPRPAAGRSAELIEYAGRSRRWRSWSRTRRAFSRLGASVVADDAGDPVRMILRRLEQMRNLQGAGRT